MDADVRRQRVQLESAVLAGLELASTFAMQWGVDDCSLWCAQILRVALGYDAGSRFRGRYHTRLGARRVLGKAGLAGALRHNARAFDWRVVKCGLEQPGDIGLLVGQKGIASTVICRASGWFVGRELNGFAAVPSRMVKTIWAVV